MNTRKRYQEIQRTARRLVDAIGIQVLDAMAPEPRDQIIIGLAKQLQVETQTDYKTARKHIERACSLARGERIEPNWGGRRPGAGRPPSTDKQGDSW